MMIRLGYIRSLSVSRYNRRLHDLASWLEAMLVLLGELFAKGEAFIVDSLLLPEAKRVRARRCKKVLGKAFCGYCAATRRSSLAGVCIWSLQPRAFSLALCS